MTRLQLVAALAGDAPSSPSLCGDLELALADETVICLATVASRPCLILMTCRAWPRGNLRFGLSTLFKLMFRLASRPDDLGQRADLELILRRVLDLALVENDLSTAAFEIKAVGQFLPGLMDRVLDFHRVDVGDDVE